MYFAVAVYVCYMYVKVNSALNVNINSCDISGVGLKSSVSILQCPLVLKLHCSYCHRSTNLCCCGVFLNMRINGKYLFYMHLHVHKLS